MDLSAVFFFTTFFLAGAGGVAGVGEAAALLLLLTSVTEVVGVDSFVSFLAEERVELIV